MASASTSAPANNSLEGLEAAVASATTLVQRFANTLAAIYAAPESPSADTAVPPLDALRLAGDATQLVRSHATKLSLLLINEPFTPSAIRTVVGELVSGPLPALASAVQSCQPSSHTRLFRRELAWRAKRVLHELAALLSKVPGDGKTLSGPSRDAFRPNEKGSMAATGLLWAACDEVTALVDMGVGGLFVRKVEEWRDTLRDIMEELKEWGDEEPDDDDDDEDEDDNEDDDGDGRDDSGQGPTTNTANAAAQAAGSISAAQAAIDELMGSGGSIPKDDPDAIRPRLESSIRRLRLVMLLYQAIVKRRLKKLPPLPVVSGPGSVPQRLDEAATVLCKLPEDFGNLAQAFYELEPGLVDQAMDKCFFSAFAAGEMLTEDWAGGRDEFSEWTSTFKVEIRKT